MAPSQDLDLLISNILEGLRGCKSNIHFYERRYTWSALQDLASSSIWFVLLECTGLTYCGALKMSFKTDHEALLGVFLPHSSRIIMFVSGVSHGLERL